jgi:hypothetical protein
LAFLYQHDREHKNEKVLFYNYKEMAVSLATSAGIIPSSKPDNKVIQAVQAIQGMKRLLDEKPELVVEITNKVTQLQTDIKNPVHLLVDIMEFVEQISKIVSLGGDMKKEICKAIFSNIITDEKTIELFSGTLDVLIDTIVTASKGGLNINLVETFCDKCCGMFSSTK